LSDCSGNEVGDTSSIVYLSRGTISYKNGAICRARKQLFAFVYEHQLPNSPHMIVHRLDQLQLILAFLEELHHSITA
jgi:hypothetical protein